MSKHWVMEAKKKKSLLGRNLEQTQDLMWGSCLPRPVRLEKKRRNTEQHESETERNMAVYSFIQSVHQCLNNLVYTDRYELLH